MQTCSAERVRVGIAGAGLMGNVHAGVFALDSRAVITTVIDPEPSARAALAEQHRCRAFESLDAALAAGETDLLVVATPPSTHASLAAAAFAAGVSVLVEKPLCLDVEEARLMARAQSGQSLFVAENLWFAPSWRAGLKQASALGPVTSLKATFRTSGPHRPWLWTINEGGLVFDLGTHCIAMACLLFSQERPRVCRVSGSKSTGHLLDEIHLALEFGEHVAECELSWREAGGEICSFEMQAGRGRIVVSLAPEAWARSFSSMHRSTHDAEARFDGTDWITFGGYQQQASAVLDAMTGLAAYPIPAAAGVDIIKVASHARNALERDAGANVEST